MVRRACLFEVEKMKPTTATITTATTTTATTTTTTTAYRKGKAEVKVKDEVEEADRVLRQPVVEAAYPNLVSNNKMNYQYQYQ